jgi:hypothetical protein
MRTYKKEKRRKQKTEKMANHTANAKRTPQHYSKTETGIGTRNKNDRLHFSTKLLSTSCEQKLNSTMQG